jgi:hypothetical protein
MKDKVLILGITFLISAAIPVSNSSEVNDITMLKKLRQKSIQQMRELAKKIGEEKNSAKQVSPEN